MTPMNPLHKRARPRPHGQSVSLWRRGTAQAGFSLLELMIAIMILGIGLVMVATVFPVGLDIASETIQRHISTSVADCAINILKLRVPKLSDLDGDANPNSARVLVGQAISTPDGSKFHIDPDADIDAEDFALLANLLVNNGTSVGDYFTSTWNVGVPANRLSERAAVLTERSGWPAENYTNLTAVLPSQNIRVFRAGFDPSVAPVDFLRGLPVMISPRIGGVALQPELPRINFADQVYPPVPLTTTDASGSTVPRSSQDLLDEFTARRYNWTAIHHRMSSSNQQDGQLVTLIITHRADLNARFARQADPGVSADYDPTFNPANSDNRLAMLKPAADPDASLDVIFPRPWLVMLRKFNSGGIVHCTPEVARLLPSGSQFVIAVTKGSLVAGTAHEVKSSEWPQAFDFGQGTDNSALDPGADTEDLQGRIQLAQGTGGNQEDVLVWVFPPAYDRAGGGVFRRQTPVVGVAIRTIE